MSACMTLKYNLPFVCKRINITVHVVLFVSYAERRKVQFVIRQYSVQNKKLKLEVESLRNELEKQRKETESINAQADYERIEPKGGSQTVCRSQ